MKNCENCSSEHDGTYGSGRFCNNKCARGFSTKNKRNEINEKVSNSLKGKPTNRISKKEILTKKCNACEKIFTTDNKNRKFCSVNCSSHSPKPGNGGPRDGGGRTKVLEYISNIAGSMKLNSDEIIVAKILDDLFLNWERNSSNGFQYLDLEGRERKFYPDFYLKDYDLYIEYKGWIDKKVENKMSDALSKNNFKLLVIYSNDPRYKKLGLCLEELENNKDILFKYIKESI